MKQQNLFYSKPSSNYLKFKIIPRVVALLLTVTVNRTLNKTKFGYIKSLIKKFLEMISNLLLEPEF